jgi:hypothetical protein
MGVTLKPHVIRGSGGRPLHGPRDRPQSRAGFASAPRWPMMAATLPGAEPYMCSHTAGRRSRPMAWRRVSGPRRSVERGPAP